MEKMDRRVLVSSIAEVIGEHKRRFRLEDGVPQRESISMAMRIGLFAGLTLNIQRELIRERYDDVIITLPLSIMNPYGAVDHQLAAANFRLMAEMLESRFGQKLEDFVCLINDPRKIITQMSPGEKRSFAHGPIQMLEWMAMEVVLSEMLSQGIARKTEGWNWFVFPNDSFSTTSLAKIILDRANDTSPYVCYVAHPISEILRMIGSADAEQREEGERLRALIHQFKKAFLDYSVVISPIEIAEFKTDVLGDPLLGRLLRIVKGNIERLRQGLGNDMTEEDPDQPALPGMGRDGRGEEKRIMDEVEREFAVKLEREDVGLLRSLAEMPQTHPVLVKLLDTLLENAAKTTVDEYLRAHTVHRDLYWFVRAASEVVAYYPASLTSPGAENEIREAISIGKSVVLVKEKPSGKPRKKGGAKDSPFYFERDIPPEKIFRPPSKFFAQKTARYRDVEDVVRTHPELLIG